ncbi:glucose-6-phosphate isomerase [Sesbania bispinosa]|nr:glucose-6-phosphate isomerase [Sesbania bispinosa]
MLDFSGLIEQRNGKEVDKIHDDAAATTWSALQQHHDQVVIEQEVCEMVAHQSARTTTIAQRRPCWKVKRLQSQTHSCYWLTHFQWVIGHDGERMKIKAMTGEKRSIHS